jgi:hypothetical protein
MLTARVHAQAQAHANARARIKKNTAASSHAFPRARTPPFFALARSRSSSPPSFFSLLMPHPNNNSTKQQAIRKAVARREQGNAYNVRTRMAVRHVQLGEAAASAVAEAAGVTARQALEAVPADADAYPPSMPLALRGYLTADELARNLRPTRAAMVRAADAAAAAATAAADAEAAEAAAGGVGAREPPAGGGPPAAGPPARRATRKRAAATAAEDDSDAETGASSDAELPTRRQRIVRPRQECDGVGADRLVADVGAAADLGGGGGSGSPAAAVAAAGAAGTGTGAEASASPHLVARGPAQPVPAPLAGSGSAPAAAPDATTSAPAAAAPAAAPPAAAAAAPEADYGADFDEVVRADLEALEELPSRRQDVGDIGGRSLTAAVAATAGAAAFGTPQLVARGTAAATASPAVAGRAPAADLAALAAAAPAAALAAAAPAAALAAAAAPAASPLTPTPAVIFPPGVFVKSLVSRELEEVEMWASPVAALASATTTWLGARSTTWLGPGNAAASVAQLRQLSVGMRHIELQVPAVSFLPSLRKAMGGSGRLLHDVGGASASHANARVVARSPLMSIGLGSSFSSIALVEHGGGGDDPEEAAADASVVGVGHLVAEGSFALSVFVDRCCLDDSAEGVVAPPHGQGEATDLPFELVFAAGGRAAVKHGMVVVTSGGSSLPPAASRVFGGGAGAVPTFTVQERPRVAGSREARVVELVFFVSAALETTCLLMAEAQVHMDVADALVKMSRRGQ